MVDCRIPRDYRMGHIPRAINLPVDASLGELSEALREIEGRSKICCYCMNEHCAWAAKVASMLRGMGHEDCVVYAPGWNGFVKEQQSEKKNS